MLESFSSVTQSCPTLWPHGFQHARPPCTSPTPGACSDSYPLHQWCHPAISSSVIPFSSCLQSFPASGSFLMSQFFTSGGQSMGVSASASVLPMNIQGWLPLGLTGLISLLSKGCSRVFSSTTIRKHQFFRAQPSLWSKSSTLAVAQISTPLPVHPPLVSFHSPYVGKLSWLRNKLYSYTKFHQEKQHVCILT